MDSYITILIIKTTKGIFYSFLVAPLLYSISNIPFQTLWCFCLNSVIWDFRHRGDIVVGDFVGVIVPVGDFVGLCRKLGVVMCVGFVGIPTKVEAAIDLRHLRSQSSVKPGFHFFKI
jgi:hypothetical protein